jgi:hypothetical protein
MRQLITGLVAAAAVVTVSAAPAMACGGLFTQCGVQAYVSPCGGCGASYGYGAGYGTGYGYGYGVAERLPEPSPQYFYANQGPVYSGPGMYAPVPTYQESAVSGWGAYQTRGAYYGYEGGHYANATNHYDDGMTAVEGPVVQHYQPHYYRRPHYNGYGYGSQRYAPHYSMHRGYAPQYSMRDGYHGAPRYYGQRVLRRYY